jgi:predicted Zn-dependent peptidase
MKEEFYTYTLPNGIRGIHRKVKSGAARCALIIGAGSRDELPTEHGIAHFAEHGLFKGTTHRKSYQVNCRLENLGGELNAFTTKEDTTVHATVLRNDFTKAVDLLSDVVFHSTFPDKELDKEREVIIDEINTYKDSPMDMIYDTFEDMLFEGSELGHNILGTKRDLMRHNSAALHRFVDRTYTTDQMVFASIGNISDSRIEQIANRYFADYKPTTRSHTRTAPGLYTAFDREQIKHTHQAHCIIGNRAYSINEDKRVPFLLLINILGGPTANSRLNVSVRERNGLSYNIEANYTAYNDCGMAVIYFSSEHCNSDHCRQIIADEIKKLQTVRLTTRQLAMAKRQYIAQMTISTEGNEGYMLGVGRSMLVHGEVDTLEEAYKKINAVTADQIMEVANEIFTNNSTLIYR